MIRFHFVLIAFTKSYRFADRIFPLEGDGFLNGVACGKNRSDAIGQGATMPMASAVSPDERSGDR